jgi:hypothetical protein
MGKIKLNTEFKAIVVLFAISVALAIFIGGKSHVTGNADSRLELIIKIDANHGLKDLVFPIKQILSDKYKISFSDQNYNVIFEGPFSSSGHYRPELKDRNFKEYSPLDPKVVKIFWTGEAILPNLDSYDLTIGFDRVEHPNYIRFPLYYSFAFGPKIRTGYNREADLGKCNTNKKFACFLVSSNSEEHSYLNHLPFDGCAARVEIFHKLSLYKRVESGGKLLNNVYGPVSNGMEWLSQCKFVIAYENQSWNGYITEKVMQAYFAGAIPIYYGDLGKDAIRELNKNAIIYAKDFNNSDELVEYVKKVDNDDELYCSIWNQNIISKLEDSYEIAETRLRKKLYEVIDRKLGISSDNKYLRNFQHE